MKLYICQPVYLFFISISVICFCLAVYLPRVWKTVDSVARSTAIVVLIKSNISSQSCSVPTRAEARHRGMSGEERKFEPFMKMRPWCRGRKGGLNCKSNPAENKNAADEF